MIESHSESTVSRLSNEELFQQYSDLMYRVAHAFHKKARFCEFQDLVQVARLSALKAYRKYNQNRGAISTLLHVSMCRDLVKYIRKQYKYRNQENVSLDFDIEKSEHFNVDQILPTLSDEEHRLVELLRMGHRKSVIQKELGLTDWKYRTAISSVKRKILESNE